MEDRIYTTEVSDKFETTDTNHIFALAEAEKDFTSKTYKIGDEKVTVFKDTRGRFSMTMGEKVPVTVDKAGEPLTPLAVALEAQFDAGRPPDISHVDIDGCLNDIVEWVNKNNRPVTAEELRPIVDRHCSGKIDRAKILYFLMSEEGGARISDMLSKSRKDAGVK